MEMRLSFASPSSSFKATYHFLSTLIVVVVVGAVDGSSSYGPFDGNRDVLCNAGTQYECYCSVVSWRRFDRTDAPLCSRLLPNYPAAVLELASCDVRLDENPFAPAIGQAQPDDEPTRMITFERYLKRTLAVLIRRQCQKQEQQQADCVRIPSDVNEEQVVFALYECSKDLLTSRLWILVWGEANEHQEQNQNQNQGRGHRAQDPTSVRARWFADGRALSAVLGSQSVLSELNHHLIARRSRVIDIFHRRMEEASDSSSSAGEKADNGENMVVKLPPQNPPLNYDEVENANDRREDGTNITANALENTKPFNWVAVVVVTLFVLYFVLVWIISVVFCLRKRREIQAKNSRLKGETNLRNATKNEDEKRREKSASKDPATAKELMSREEDSEYDNL